MKFQEVNEIPGFFVEDKKAPSLFKGRGILNTFPAEMESCALFNGNPHRGQTGDKIGTNPSRHLSHTG